MMRRVSNFIPVQKVTTQRARLTADRGRILGVIPNMIISRINNKATPPVIALEHPIPRLQLSKDNRLAAVENYCKVSTLRLLLPTTVRYIEHMPVCCVAAVLFGLIPKQTFCHSVLTCSLTCKLVAPMYL